MHFGVPVPPAGKVGQEKGDTRADFLMPLLWGQHHPVPNLWPWSESETGHLGTGLPPRSM